jgi:RimJ/RimL family protein N-acetyltransferase
MTTNTAAVPDLGSARPPEEVDLGVAVLRRQQADDAERISRAVTESMDHLRPFMPWATPENATVPAQQARLVEVERSWAEGSEFVFSLLDPTRENLLGTLGLHPRVGPHALEIGYWVHVDHVGKGLATTAAGTLTEIALGLPGIDLVEIHCDVANAASAAVPRRLGYRLDRTIDHEPEAEAETGRRMVWLYPA